MNERTRRLNQMLRVARNRMRRNGSRRGLFIWKGNTPQLRSDFHIEVRRLLGLLGRQDEADAMEARRKRLVL